MNALYTGDAAWRGSRGFTLLEVLVAVFVLAIGLLSVGGLQLSSKRANFEAVQRATAVALAQDIVERMRANPEQLAVYTNAGLGRLITGADMAALDCAGGCTADQVALLDLYEWEQSMAGATEQSAGANRGGLSLPTACILGPNGGSGNYTVAIAWRGLTRLSDPTRHACGAGLGLYDHVDGGLVEADSYRRLVLVDTYIVQGS